MLYGVAYKKAIRSQPCMQSTAANPRTIQPISMFIFHHHHKQLLILSQDIRYQNIYDRSDAKMNKSGDADEDNACNVM
jgi:hypothetical protein